MTNEIKNVPELRFPEFKEEWSKLKLGELAEIVRGSSPRPISDPRWFDINSDIGWLRISDVTEQNGKITKLEQKISKDGQKKTRVLHSKHLLLSIAATVGKPVINYVKTGVHDGFLIFLRPLFDIEFMYQWLDAYRPKWKKYGQPGSQVNLNSELVKSQKIYMPHSVEQKKISDFFSKLDHQIELEEQKLKKLEEQKKGYMQKIFSQELRFKDDNGNSYPDWSIKKIEDISKVNKGFTPNTKNDEYWDELNENWLSIAGMTQKYLYKGNKGITEKGASKHVKVDKDTLIMSFKLTLGKLAIVKEPIYTNEAICHFVWKESNVNTEYMYYYLNSINISTFGAQAVKGVTLNNDSINSIIVKLPVIQEQNKIAYFFNELDKLIRKQYAKIELLKQRKNGLLQKMFV
ncbi:restriction endonuclease subunit S [Staphylococcus sp. IVB6214]|uniref:restriction endonuclease subunit S n=1 Tax=Staphylococcus sp. IVB6214 TaxID=2989766 RepID=UPI0021D07C3F|nr:restriction endonuclease subunit S [Staphylococcus sp. IVB6214]UXR82547.1 restriction endonuclease subunit S [Staphylococcus sp. IVB6214]